MVAATDWNVVKLMKNVFMCLREDKCDANLARYVDVSHIYGAFPASKSDSKAASRIAAEVIEGKDGYESPARESPPVEIEHVQWPRGFESPFDLLTERRFIIVSGSAHAKLKIWKAAVAEILSLNAAASTPTTSCPKKRVEIVIVLKDHRSHSSTCNEVHGEVLI
ncbi:hypothetical protein KCU83_g4010, partial [Aureobasidium melanogenum]